MAANTAAAVKGAGFRLKLEGELPEIQGRGREADPIPADLLADLRTLVEAGKGVMEYTGTQSEVAKHKGFVSRFADQTQGVGKPVFRNAGTNPDGTPSKLKTGSKNQGTPVATIVYSVKRVDAQAK